MPTNQLIRLLLIMALITACSSTEENGDFYESGNLHFKETNQGDSLVSTFFYDSGTVLKRSRFWEIDNVVVRSEYYNTKEEVIFKSRLKPKTINYRMESDTLLVRLLNPENDYFSLINPTGGFDWRFNTFLSRFNNSDGIFVRLTIKELPSNSFDVLVFDHNMEMINDSMARIVGDHWFTTVELDSMKVDNSR